MPSVQFLPQQPSVGTDMSDPYWKDYIMQLWRAHHRNLVVGISQTVAFTADIETYFYPCDTTGGAFVVTLPAAADYMGKQYEVYHLAGINALTITLTGTDVLSPASVSPIALGSSVLFISDGSGTWYAMPGGATSSGGGLATQVFTTAGPFNYTVPTGCSLIEVELCGAGGSGGGGGNAGAAGGGGGGGGAGEYIGPRFQTVTSGAVLAGTVGTGAASVAATTNGLAGSATVFNGFTASGGLGGLLGTGGGAGGIGGAGGGRLGPAGGAAGTIGGLSVQEVNLAASGASGGGGGSAAAGGNGGIFDGVSPGAGGALNGTRGGGGGGGCSEPNGGGQGGAGNNAGVGVAGTAGTLGSGGGGGGAGSTTGGASGKGGDGWVKITAYT